ncbi:MAG: hypothetical protein WHV66_06110 [Anaerolineales bacterium]|jgi:hypothetical protein
MESARKFSATEAKSLYEYFQAMVDLRRKRGGRHPLAAPLLLIVLAEMCGEDKPMCLTKRLLFLILIGEHYHKTNFE